LLRAQILLGVDQPDGYERAWTAYYGISPERHQAYSVQWYGLALTLLVLYMVVSVKRGRSI
jgi:surfeit locus 1 family protein